MLQIIAKCKWLPSPLSFQVQMWKRLCLERPGRELKNLILYWMPSKAKSGRCVLVFEIAGGEIDLYMI